MKFCPKCSLKIKGNVTQCPICKVELLSCAEDDELKPMPSKEEDQKHKTVETDQTPSTEIDTQDVEPNANFKVTKQEKSADKSDYTRDYPDLNDRIGKLEDSFKEIDSKLNISISQSDVFSNAATDLESRITKADQALDKLKHALETPSEYIQQVEKELSRLTLHMNHIVKDLEIVKRNVTNLEAKLAKPSSSFEEMVTPGDLPIEKAENQGEGTSFPEHVEEDFGNEFEIHTPPSREEIFIQPAPERKKFSLIIILILFAIVISSWLGFYYFRSRSHESSKELITEKIEISPILKKNIDDAPKRSAAIEQTSKVETEETKPKETGEILSQENYALTTIKATKEKPTPLKESKTRQTTFKKVSGYTVNVGSFKDKNRALALTKKLRGEGYSAVMSTSKNKKMYRVSIGAFLSYKEALSSSTTLEKKEKLPTFIAKTNMP